MAKIQSSGEIKLSDIMAQTGRSSKTDFSLDGAENGNTAAGYASINLCSPNRPGDTDPASFSEWYNYDHGAACNAVKKTVVYSNYTSDLCNANPGSTGTNTGGTSSFTYNADYIIFTYQFTDGKDLDTRTRIVTPNVGQTTATNYIGWNYKVQWPLTGTPILRWGGDNKGTGFESVLLNLIAFRAAYPAATSIVMDLRGFWYETIGVQPVKVAATMYKGGTITGPTNFTFGNTGYTSTSAADSLSKKVTMTARGSGERIATFTYDLLTNVGTFNINDTITPSV